MKGRAPRNSHQEFLAVRGVVGMGQVLTKAIPKPFRKYSERLLLIHAGAREGVAMAFPRFGDTDMGGLLSEMERWSRGSFLEMRAATVSLCEPRLLKQTEHAIEMLRILDRITKSISSAKNRNTDDFKA